MWQFQPTEGKSSPTQFRLRQLLDKPTRGDQILDLVLTNLSDLYDKNAVDILPLFGLSDHDVVYVRPKRRTFQEGPSRKTVLKRDTWASGKSELGRFPSSIDWSVVDEVPNCEANLELFADTIRTGLDHIMPFKQVRLNTSDPPWINEKFKTLISSDSKLSTEMTKMAISITAIKSTVKGNHSTAGIMCLK